MRLFSTGFSEGFDGPGRRWVVYLKGCNLRCRWCANPESLSREPQILFYPHRSPYCREACGTNAVSVEGSSIRLDRTQCRTCSSRECVQIFKDPAFEWAGHDLSIEQLVKKAEQYRPLFGMDGGVTFGGGEPSLQDKELFAALEQLREEKIHSAVETNGTTDAAKKLIGKVDLLICDLKCISRDRHIEWTGLDNDRVLETLTLACDSGQSLRIRIPVVRGFNDMKSEWRQMADFLCERKESGGRFRVEVLRMHHLGQPKYEALGMEYPMNGIEPPSLEQIQELSDYLKARNLRVDRS